MRFSTVSLFLQLAHSTVGRSFPQARQSESPVVDLDYAIYRGIYNSSLDQTIFRGIRFAAPPTGPLRWQLPEPPVTNRTEEAIPAISDPTRCPPSRRSLNYAKTASEEALLASFDGSGDEDCLFLNIFAPALSSSLGDDQDLLPVLVYIHGGGYGLDSAASFDFSSQIATNDNRYIAVAIQYRLGAFGFLAGDVIAQHGVLNVGLHDMRFALQWVRRYIDRFGGDPDRVTVAGQSAGGGAAMLLTTADMSGFSDSEDGSGDETLFQQAILASPWLPTQSFYNDSQPTDAFEALVEHVGCDTSSDIFACLQNLDTATLQNASDLVSTRARYGQWAFIPVTDGTFIPDLPSRLLIGTDSPQLQSTRVLTTNVENEGPYFVWQNITNDAIFRSWLASNYPLLTPDNITALYTAYDIDQDELDALSSQPVNGTDPGFDTNGVSGPFDATTLSNYGRGWQQAANNLYAEATFICPSYWLADAHSRSDGGQAWRYQFSVPPAYHGTDIGSGSQYDVLLVSPDEAEEDDVTGTSGALRWALQRAWGNFIVHGDPTLGTSDVLEAMSLDGMGGGDDVAAAGVNVWAAWDGAETTLIVNVTGGEPVETTAVFDGEATLQVTAIKPAKNASNEPLAAQFSVVDGEAFEGGRGGRCAFLAEMGPWLME